VNSFALVRDVRWSWQKFLFKILKNSCTRSLLWAAVPPLPWLSPRLGAWVLVRTPRFTSAQHAALRGP